MVDSGDVARAGVIVGALAGYRLSDGNWEGAAVGAGAGMVVGGEGTEQALKRLMK